jgi:hypothetical protein
LPPTNPLSSYRRPTHRCRRRRRRRQHLSSIPVLSIITICISLSCYLTTTVFHFSVSPEPNFSHTHATFQLNPASVAPPLILILLMASVPHPGSAQSSLQLPQDGSPSTLSWEGEKMFVGHCFFLCWSHPSDLFRSLGSIFIFTTIATSEDFGRLLVSS